MSLCTSTRTGRVLISYRTHALRSRIRFHVLTAVLFAWCRNCLASLKREWVIMTFIDAGPAYSADLSLARISDQGVDPSPF